MLVGTTASGAEVRAKSRRCVRDRVQARAQTEDGSARCVAYSGLVAEGRFSTDPGAELGESGSAAIALASASGGASAYADHELIASGSTERRPALQEEVVARTWAPATGGDPISAMGQPTPARSVGVSERLPRWVPLFRLSVGRRNDDCANRTDGKASQTGI